MPPDADAAKIIDRNPPLIDTRVDGNEHSYAINARARQLALATGYVWLVDAVDARGKVTSTSAPGLFYANDPSSSFPMEQWLCCNDEDLMLHEDFTEWQPAYGSPTINDKGVGCSDAAGTIHLTGALGTGDAVTQQLRQPIRANEHYLVSFCARSADADLLTQFRVYAHNDTLPTTGVHPPVSASVASIGLTGQVEPGGWTWFVLPPWRANRDFSRVAIAAAAAPALPGLSPTNKAAGEVSNICIRRVDDCNGFFTAGPNLELGTGIQIDTSTEAYAQAVTSDLGAMVDLFGENFDELGTNNWYREGDGCASIGGWVPDDIDDDVPWSDAEADDETFDKDILDQIIKHVADELLKPELSDRLEPIDLVLDDCADHDPVPHPREIRPDPGEVPIPFGGRDIIFVHGIIPSQVIARGIADDPLLRSFYDSLPSPPGALPKDMVDSVALEWPENRAPYTADLATSGTDSYFRRSGETYWRHHIQENLLNPGHDNRFLVAGFNSSQRLVYGVHAVLSQIARAMSTGEGVADPSGKYGTGCFGREIVFVTHSTGSLLINVAMSIAASTATDSELRDTYGDLSEIARRGRVHIATHGAIAGSNVAQAAVAAAVVTRGHIALDGLVTDIKIWGMRTLALALAEPEDRDEIASFFDAILAADDMANAALASIPDATMASVAVDLCPLVAKTAWPRFIASSPVPTLTIAGGHPTHGGIPAIVSPSGTAWPTLITKLVLGGFDDGAVPVNSQAGSNSPTEYDSYLFAPPLGRLFDMGLPLSRSAPWFTKQANAPLSAYGSIPFLGPSGMVQPVLSAPIVPRYPNIHPFIQSPSEHAFSAVDASGAPTPGTFRDYEQTLNDDNYEECLVLESSTPFDEGLVDRTIQILVRRHERRLDLTVTALVPVPRITLFPPTFSIDLVPLRYTVPVWRRFYDLLSPEGGASASTIGTVAVTTTPTSVQVGSTWPNGDAVQLALDGPNRMTELDYAYRFAVPR